MNEEEKVAVAKAAIMSAGAAKQRKAAERKQKMAELEAERKLAVPPSEIEQQKLQEQAALLSAADKQMAEELDDVKKINQVCI